MNREIVLLQLKEAKEAIDNTIAEIEEDVDYCDEELRVNVSHIYTHLNTAWNCREIDSKVFEKCTTENFNKWRKFPKESEVSLLDT